MIKPDVIVTNPYGIEHPSWRYEMQKNRDRFAKIIIGYYDDFRRYNFKDFIVKTAPWATHVDIGTSTGRDWRDDTVNACLEKSNARWVLFMEQDFVPGPGFWETVLADAKYYDVAGYGDQGIWNDKGVRLHPAFILVRRRLVDLTQRDFGAYPKLSRDHFGIFTDELYKMKADLLAISGKYFCNRYSWRHWKGLYSNYMLVLQGKKPNFEPEAFKEYVVIAMRAPVVQDERFIKWSKNCLKILSEK